MGRKGIWRKSRGNEWEECECMKVLREWMWMYESVEGMRYLNFKDFNFAVINWVDVYIRWE